MPNVDKIYEHDGLKVRWQSALCSHCENCVTGLPSVFNLKPPKSTPWIDLRGADKERVIAQVSDCPTQAISVVK